MRRLAEQPGAWVLGNALVVLALLYVSGRLEARVEPDTPLYQTMPLDSLEAALSQVRTVGYPFFLRVVRAATGTDRAAPYFHFLVYVLAVLLFGRALQAAGFSPGARGAACCVLLWSHAVFEFTGPLLTDALGVAAAIVVISALILTLWRASSPIAWMGLTLAIFAAYQIRPVYQFLAPLTPCLGLWLAVFAFRLPLDWRKGLRLFVLLALAAMGPLLAFCVFRWSVVGHFGLVSFDGYNWIGVAGQLLDEDLLPELSPEVRPLAREILKRRAVFPAWEAPVNYFAMERNYNSLLYQITVPAAADLYDGDLVQMNDQMTALAMETLALRPREYLRWLAWSGRDGLRSVLILFITDKGTRLCLLALLLMQAAVMRRYGKTGRLPAPWPPSEQRYREVNTLVWLAIGYGAPKLLLVMAVQVPNHRYVSAAMIFTPTVAAVLTWYRWVQVREFLWPACENADS
jgi:hypothetical protein